MKFSHGFLIAIGMLLISAPIKAQTLEEQIETLLPKQVTDSTPGFVLGVVQGGELVFSKGYGMANMAYGIPNSPKMLYNVGSVSKQFLGYAFAMLHAEGKINVDEPVTKFLDDWPTFKHEVTVRHLLTHTSGYREAYTMSSLAGRTIGVDFLSKEECLNVVRRQPELEFTPGSRFTYNSTAWVILAEILEEVTGVQADIWVEDNILRPLKMENTSIESFVGEVIPDAAESYRGNAKDGYENPKSNRAIFGAAEIYSSIEELALWLNNFRSKPLGGQSAFNEFVKPYELSDGSSANYGMGIFVDQHRGLLRYSHTGGHEAFVTQLSYYPEHDIGFITVSNYGGGGVFRTNQLAAELLKEHMKPMESDTAPIIELKRSQWEVMEGSYVSETYNEVIDLEMKDGFLTVWGNSALMATSDSTFRIEGWGGRFSMTQREGKTIFAIHGDETSVYTKLDTWSPTSAEIENYVGDYWSDELETVYHLKLNNDTLMMTHRWLGELSLKSAGKDLFSSMWGTYLKFERDDSGKITGFNINSGRTLNVFFRRKD